MGKSKLQNQYSEIIRANSIALIISCLFCVSGFGQVVFEPIYYNITTEHGLPSQETYSVRQDSKGYIWICTDAGVTRYDGYNFKTFTVSDGLTDNVVFDIYEDYKGRIWFISYNSLLSYFENGKIVKYRYNNKIAEFVHEDITGKALIIDSNDNLYYTLRFKGMYKIDKNGKYQQLHHNSYSYFTKIIEGNGLISIRMESIKAIKNGIENLPINGKYPKEPYFTPTTSSLSFYPKAKFNLDNNYVLFNNSIYDIRRNEIVFRGEFLTSFRIIDSHFWICSLKGISRGHVSNNGQIKVDSVYFERMQFSNIIKIEDFYMMSTIDNGVLVCKDFDYLKTDFSHGLIDGAIVSMTKLKNDLIVSSTGKIQNVDLNLISDCGIPERSSKKIKSIDDVLILFSSNTIEKKIVDKKLHAKVQILGYSRDIKVTGNKILTSSTGVFENDLDQDSILKNVKYLSWDDKTLYSQGSISAFETLPNGQLIVGSNNGLFEVKNRQAIPYDIGVKDLRIVSLNYDTHWGLIIGTKDKGVYFLKNKILTHFDVASGLLSNQVNTIYIKDQMVYIGSILGVDVLSKKNGKVQNFSYSTLNVYENFDVNSILVDEKWIYFGTNTGLVKLKKSKFFKEQFIQEREIILREVFIDGELAKKQKQIDFPYFSNLLQLNFSVFEFDNWNGKQFQYRIGKDGQWVNIDNPSISLYRPSGSFDLEVRYLKVNNKWSKSTILCYVNVIIPIWQRWYFWMLITGVFLLFLFLLNQRRQRNLYKNLIYETQMLSLEQQMQNARMNPHFIFNVFNSIHSFMLQRNIEEAEKYLMRFTRLMREILANSNEGTIELNQEYSILMKYLELEQLRFKNVFDFSIQIPETMMHVTIPGMMIQPLVENAILYCDKTNAENRPMISVEVIQENKDGICVIVKNSGVPTPENRLKMLNSDTSNAIGITRKRLSNYNKLLKSHQFGIEIEFLNEQNTAIVLRIPIITKVI